LEIIHLKSLVFSPVDEKFCLFDNWWFSGNSSEMRIIFVVEYQMAITK